MALLEILQPPHPILKTRAQPVEGIDAGVRRLIDDMFETMYQAPGIGLAAPQVGVGKRLVVIDVAEGEERRPTTLVNPEILWRSDELTTAEEGCLSLPSQFAEVTRPAAVRVRYRDADWAEHEVEADGLLARCLQHEIDHLDGILFVDHLSTLRRNMILRRLAKARRGRA